MDGPYFTDELASSLVNIFGLLFERNAYLAAIMPFLILCRFLYDLAMF